MKKFLTATIAIFVLFSANVFAQSASELRVNGPAKPVVAKRIVRALAELDGRDGDQDVHEWTANAATVDFAATIYGVANAASYAEEQLNSVAPDQIIAIFGTGLTTNTGYAQTLPLTTELSGVSVTIQHPVTGERLPAPLFFVSPSQINAAIPSALLNGLDTLSGELTTTIFVSQPNANKFSQKAVSLKRTNAGIFSANSSGRGLPAGLVLRVINQQFVYSPIVSGTPIVIANEPTYLVLFGTGLRHSSGTVVASIGGVNVPVLYSGAQGTGPRAFAGLDQINILLPQSLNGRGNVNLVVTVDGLASNVLDLRF
jgi:uncharacterized protein (TIGR03437 family)